MINTLCGLGRGVVVYVVYKYMSDNSIQKTNGETSKVSPQKENDSKKITRNVWYSIIIFLAFGVGILVGYTYQKSIPSIVSHITFNSQHIDTTPSATADLSSFWGAWNLLKSNFVETHASSTIPTTKQEVYGAIKGITASYGDPYTVFMPPQDAKIFKQNITGSFGGIGVEIGMKKNVLTVISPLKNTPGARAGILSGDKIIAINNKSTDGISIDDAVKLIRGIRGTTVVLTIMRDNKLHIIKVVRSTIQIPEIKYALDKKDNIFHIALYTFTANSPQLFDNALKSFKSSGSDKLILDLRGNPGGYLNAAVDITSHFLPKGDVIVTEDYKGKQQNVIHRSLGYDDVSSNVKIVVLINQGSASAAEIISGALQDHHRAILIGTRSFGKGSVQEMFPIDSGSLKITVARWLTPSGKSISDGGLTPNIVSNRTEKDVLAGKDPQMARAIQFFKTGK